MLQIWRISMWQLLDSNNTRTRQVWFHIPFPRTAQIFLSQLQKLSTEMGCKILLNSAMRKSTGFPAKASGIWGWYNCFPPLCCTGQSRMEQGQQIVTFLHSFSLNHSTGDVTQTIFLKTQCLKGD